MAEKQRTTKNNIRILSVVWFKVLPAKYGGQKGTALFNKYLSREVNVICLCSRNNDPGKLTYKVINKLPISKLQFLNPFCWSKIYNVTQANQITHVILEYPYYGAAGFLIKKLLRQKLIIHNHNIEYLRFRNLGKWWWKALFFFERWTNKNADLNIFKTHNDRNIAVNTFNLNDENCFILPYCVEKAETVDKNVNKEVIASRHNFSINTKIILFAGTLDYLPNSKAVETILNDIIPALKKKADFAFKVIICGRNQLPAFQYLKTMRNESLINADEVEDIESYFSASDVFIAPVKDISGIQTKIIDALSYNCTVVAFEKTLEGIPLKICGNKVLPVQNFNTDLFADKITEAVQIHSTLPSEFFDYFNWEKRVNQLLSRLKQLSMLM